MRGQWMLSMAAAGVLATACSDATTGLDGFGRHEVLTELRRQESVWESHQLVDYRYEFRRSCDCPAVATQPVEIEVRDGEVFAVRLLSNGESISPDAAFWPSIPELFGEIRLALDGGASAVDVRYDPVLGYPLEIAITWPAAVGPNTLRLFAAELMPLP